MELDGLKTFAQVGPWGALVILAIIYVIREIAGSRTKDANDADKLKPILDKLDLIENSIQKIMIDFEKKVPYDHLETKYLSKEVIVVMIDNMKDSIKRAHERIDSIEKNGSKGGGK